MKHDSLGGVRIKPEHLTQVPCYRFTLAVLIGCEPHRIGFLHLTLQVSDKSLLLSRNLIHRHKSVLNIDAEFFLVKVSDMSVARHNFIVGTQKFFYCFCLSRRLYYD